MSEVFWFEQREYDLPPGLDWLSTNELACVQRMRIPKRRNDWCLGRWTAKRALSFLLGRSGQPVTLAGIEILAAPSGAPQAFLCGNAAGVSISLSHRAGRAVCAIARSPAPLGCDLELVEPRSSAFIEDYLCPEELMFVTNTAALDTVVTLLWSAKESALKALTTGLRLDTRDVIVASIGGTISGPGGDPRPKQTGWAPLEVLCRKTELLTGYWSWDGEFVRTVVGTSTLNVPTVLNLPSCRQCDGAVGWQRSAQH